MELRDYFLFLKKYLKNIFYFGLSSTVFFGVFVFFLPYSYQSSLSLTILRNNSQETNDFKYDGYYSIKASEEFADIVVRWLGSPEFVVDIYSRAGVKLQSGSLRKIRNIFDANKMSAHFVEVNYSSENEDNAKKIGRAVKEALKEKSLQANELSGQELSFDVVGSEPVILKAKPNFLLWGGIGFILGILFGGFKFALKEYLATESEKN